MVSGVQDLQLELFTSELSGYGGADLTCFHAEAVQLMHGWR